jgi:hypothetical protein
MKIEEAAKNVDIKEQKEANECMDKGTKSYCVLLNI